MFCKDLRALSNQRSHSWIISCLHAESRALSTLAKAHGALRPFHIDRGYDISCFNSFRIRRIYQEIQKNLFPRYLALYNASLSLVFIRFLYMRVPISKTISHHPSVDEEAILSFDIWTQRMSPNSRKSNFQHPRTWRDPIGAASSSSVDSAATWRNLGGRD